ncbi:HHE domain-containing protein [Mariannaea sp. PMI_226]|nr:HHE domain-containing protein [Mariannaea sp. PMI_226]
MSSISDAITKDHRELEQYYNEVINSHDMDHQERFGNQFTWELARHSVGEELIVYPAFEKYMGSKGHEMAESDRKEHHKVSGTFLLLESKQYDTDILKVKELLKEFQQMKPKEYEYLPKLKEIWTSLSKHMEEEESRDLPALEAALQSQSGESEAMAKSFGRTKAFVPTRSHPSAGEHPPFETVMGLMTAPIDHIADIFRKFPDQTISPNPSTK